MTSRLIGTGASFLFMISALFSKSLLTSPPESKALDGTDVAVENSQVQQPADLRFLESTSDKLVIKLADFKSESGQSNSIVSELVNELVPPGPSSNVVKASFSSERILRTPIDTNESLFADSPSDTSNVKQSDRESKNQEPSGKQAKESRNPRRAEAVPSKVGSVDETGGAEILSSGSGSVAARSSGSGAGYLGRSNAGGLGGGSRAGAGGLSSGGVGGSMPSIGGGGVGRTSQNTVASSAGQSSSIPSSGVTSGATSTRTSLTNGSSSNQTSLIATSSRPQLTADGKFGIPNHQYWTFDFQDRTGASNGGPDGIVDVRDADKAFNEYLFGSGPSSLTNLLAAANQVVSYSPTELQGIYRSLNSQVPQDKSPSYVTFMIIDFPIKGFYLQSSQIPDNPALNPPPGVY